MSRYTSFLVAPLLTVLAACGGADGDGGSANSARTPDAAGARRIAIAFDTLWVRGETEFDSVFVDPWYLTAGAGGVYVSDAERGLLAFSDSGAAMWDLAGLFGPIAVISDSVVAAVRGDRSLALFDVRTGRHTFTMATDVEQAQSLCRVTETHLLVAGSPDRLSIMNHSGGTPRTYPFPWRDLRDSASLLQQVTVAAPATSPGCVIALVVGNQFALTHGEDSVTLHPYVESIVVPPIRRTVETAGDEITTRMGFVSRASAAKSVAMDDSLIYIAFGGATPNREGLIDIYERTSGAYRSSAKFGAPIRALAAADGILYALVSRSGVPALAALRPRVP
jgi:hypothetical protein